jgi:hypothetical protein
MQFCLGVRRSRLIRRRYVWRRKKLEGILRFYWCLKRRSPHRPGSVSPKRHPGVVVLERDKGAISGAYAERKKEVDYLWRQPYAASGLTS